MRRKIKTGILFLTILSVALVSGCGKNKKGKSEAEMTSKFELNERQIRILEEEELSTDYNELGITQQSAIESIEEMLTYLEEKYGETFCYYGYGNDPFEPEFLEAYAESDSEERIITVYRKWEDGKYTYDDDYQNILAEEDYINALKEFINQYLDEEDYKLFVDISYVDDNWKKDSIIHDVKAGIYIFLKNKLITNIEIDEFIKIYGLWMKEHLDKEYSHSIDFIVQKEKDFDETFDFNYINQINEEKYSEYIVCSINEGKMKIKKAD